MRQRWPLAALPVAALLLLWLIRPSDLPSEPVRVGTTGAVDAVGARPRFPQAHAEHADRSVEPRREVAREIPAEGALGRMVQAAMAKPGDSDRRLLDLLAAVGAAPSSLAAVGAAVDPWVAVGLVDLERQVARRCSSIRDAGGCWATALAAEEEVAALLDDPGATEALERFRAADAEGLARATGVQGPVDDAR